MVSSRDQSAHSLAHPASAQATITVHNISPSTTPTHLEQFFSCVPAPLLCVEELRTDPVSGSIRFCGKITKLEGPEAGKATIVFAKVGPPFLCALGRLGTECTGCTDRYFTA